MDKLKGENEFNMEDRLKITEFNLFVREVIERIAVEYGQRILFDYKEQVGNKRTVLMEYDALCPDGFEDVRGPVIFEIKSRKINYETISNFEKRVRNREEFVAATIIFIVNDIIDTFYDRNNIIIWDLSKIEDWKNRYSIELFNAVHSDKDISKKFEIDIYSGRVPNENDFEGLKERFIKGLSWELENGAQLGIVLGSGVSIEQGAKSWDCLIKDLKDMVQKNNLADDINLLSQKVGGGSLITAQLCEDIFNSEDDFKWTIHESLYSLGKGTIKLGSELEAITKLTEKYKHLKHFRILTYNYDDYLERYLNKAGIKYCVLSSQKDEYYKGKNKAAIYEMKGKMNDSFAIYHVHGYLPQAPNKSSLRGTICLTEADYNLLYNQPYSWPITSQMMFFRENMCLFVGCSLTDPNIRRLLELTSNSAHWHYAILKKDDLSNRDLLVANVHFYRMGIRIIWINDYSEIVGILGRI